MATNLKSRGKITVAVSGTPARLTANETTPSARLSVHGFMVQALPGNTGKIYVMDRSNGVIATLVGVVGIIAAPATGSIPVFSVGFSGMPNPLNLADYYFDVETNTEGVLVSTLEA